MNALEKINTLAEFRGSGYYKVPKNTDNVASKEMHNHLAGMHKSSADYHYKKAHEYSANPLKSNSISRAFHAHFAKKHHQLAEKHKAAAAKIPDAPKPSSTPKPSPIPNIPKAAKPSSMPKPKAPPKPANDTKPKAPPKPKSAKASFSDKDKANFHNASAKEHNMAASETKGKPQHKMHLKAAANHKALADHYTKKVAGENSVKPKASFSPKGVGAGDFHQLSADHHADAAEHIAKQVAKAKPKSANHNALLKQYMLHKAAQTFHESKYGD